MAMALDEYEKKALAALEKLDEKDPEGSWACYSPELMRQADLTMHGLASVLPNLRRRKLVNAHGRAVHAFYHINDKGKQALKDAA